MTNKVIYPELSYEIVGVLFDVYNELGYGYQEKYYDSAVAKALDLKHIRFKRQVPFDVKYKDNKIGKGILDFLIEDKIVLELKIGKYFTKQSFNQVKGYLKSTNKKLAIMAIFTPKGVRFIRILNENNKISKNETEINLNKVRELFKY
ncbi:MAG: GxxExxY protein [Patescibacteria group bacterium]